MNKQNNPNKNKKFRQVINSNCKIAYKRDNPLIDIDLVHTLNANNTTFVEDAKNTNQVIKKYEAELMQKLRNHKFNCEELFRIEIDRYEEYYRQVKEHIDQEYQLGMTLIEKEMGKMRRAFEDSRIRIEYFARELLRSDRYRVADCNEKMRELQQQAHLELQMIEVHVPDVEAFRRDFEKYAIKFFDLQEAHENLALSSTSLRATNPPNKERNREQAERAENQLVEPQSPEPLNRSDELLACDEQLGAKASANTIRRRKYDVGRQNVIKQEDESDDTNSMMSDS